jgi:adenine-specific DNA-methyltransferase
VKGFVPTPSEVVDRMVDKLFRNGPPRPDSTVLDPGCGTGAFIEGVIRWCRHHNCASPKILGIELDSKHLPEAHARLGGHESVTILNEDFLGCLNERFDYIIGNPPYVSITKLSSIERGTYRQSYSTATGRFDLYLLFFEQALRLLQPEGRLIFVTPEKFVYVQSAASLRRALSRVAVEELHFIDEGTFGPLTTYPVITTVVNTQAGKSTTVISRKGTSSQIRLPADGRSWLPEINGVSGDQATHTLKDFSLRISCGVATGADQIYVQMASQIDDDLRPFAFPTISGREIALGKDLITSHLMLVPYNRSGELLSEAELGHLGDYLRQTERRDRLLQRTCVRRKPWYAFHENPPLADVLRPKILCKDIASKPCFVVDRSGEILPRHSVYYIVPKNPLRIGELCNYLNSSAVEEWLIGHCQRAANGFLRLQSHVLKQVPVPAGLITTPELTAADNDMVLAEELANEAGAKGR